MRKIIIALMLLAFYIAPAYAKGLSDAQIKAIIDLIGGFNVPQEVVQKVEYALKEKPEVSEMVGEVLDFACPKISRSLYLGVEGEDVKELQKFLKEKGYFDYPEITGYFGSVTLKAVQEFQKDQGIVTGGDPLSTGFGVVGPKTRSYIKSICAESEGGNTTYCTMEYDPVCGKKYPQVPNQYMKKVAPQYKTYSNMCKLKADGAEFVRKGSCDSGISIDPGVVSVDISGPRTLKVAERGIWTIYFDSKDDLVFHEISWGDNQYTFLNNYDSSQGKLSVSHAYNNEGLYDIRIKIAKRDGSEVEKYTQVQVISTVPPSPYDGEKIRYLKSDLDLYRFMDSSTLTVKNDNNSIVASWEHSNIADDEWMALLLKDNSGRVHKSIKVDPKSDKASMTINTFCNSYFSDAIDGACQSLRSAAMDGKTFYLESQIYTPKDACFGYCAPGSPKPTILEKDRSEEFNIVLSDY